jgi:hypothetical protein
MKRNYVIDKSDIRNVLVADKLSADGKNTIWLTETVNLDGATLIFAPNKVLNREEYVKFSRADKIFCGKVKVDRNGQNYDKSYACVYEYMEDSVFCAKNSELTAEALLCVLLGKLERSVRDQKILVLGYGRCGRAICRYFYDLRCDVTVATGRLFEDVLLAKPVTYEEVEFSKYDVIINTAPAKIIPDVELCRLKCEVLVLDVASAPYGLNHELAKVWEIDAEVYPSLPMKFKKKAAADAMYEFIKRKENCDE